MTPRFFRFSRDCLNDYDEGHLTFIKNAGLLGKCVILVMNMEKNCALMAHQIKPVMRFSQNWWNPNVESESDEERHLAIAHQRQPSARRCFHSLIIAETWRWTFLGVIFILKFHIKRGQAFVWKSGQHFPYLLQWGAAASYNWWFPKTASMIFFRKKICMQTEV